MTKFAKLVNRLLTKFKNGNEKAFEELYELTFYRLIYIASGYLNDKSYVEDVISEAFISVWRNIHSFDKNNNGYAWLCKIVENEAHDYNANMQSFEELAETTVFSDDVFEKVETKINVSRLLRKLNEEELLLIQMRYPQDKTLKEIALLTGQSVNVVAKKIYKIIKKLKNISKDGKKP